MVCVVGKCETGVTAFVPEVVGNGASLVFILEIAVSVGIERAVDFADLVEILVRDTRGETQRCDQSHEEEMFHNMKDF